MVDETSQKSWYWISAVLLIVVVCGSVYTFEKLESRDLCADGKVWAKLDNETDLYYCPSENSYRHCLELSKTGRTCYLMVLVNVSEEVVEYGLFHKREHLGNGRYGVVVETAPTWIPEKGGWKHKTEAESLLGYYGLSYLRDDKAVKVELVSLNWTSIGLSVKAEDASTLFKDVPVKVDGLQVGTVYLQDVTTRVNVGLDAVVGHNVSVGFSSEEVTVVPSGGHDNASARDTFVRVIDANNVDENFGNSTEWDVKGSTYAMGLAYLDVAEFVPAGRTILNCSFIPYIGLDWGGFVTFTELKVNWTEGSGSGEAYEYGNASLASPHDDYTHEDGTALWSESVTYNFKGNVTGRMLAHIDMGSGSAAWATFEFNETDAVCQDWLDDRTKNLGWVMNHTQGGSALGFRANSREAANPWRFYIEYEPADTCTPTAGQAWNVACSDNCTITSGVDLGGNGLWLTGKGTFTLLDNVIINNAGDVSIENVDGCDVILGSGSEI